MSKLDELIKELCPDGVEYKTFFDVCDYIRGITYNKNDEVNDGSDGIKVFRANNITLETNTLNYEDVKVVSSDVKVKETQWLKKGDILICAGSGSKEHIGKVAYIFESINYTFGGFMGVIRPKNKNVDTGFLFHILTSDMFKRHLAKASGSQSSTINNINNDTWKDFSIPVPPLPVQEEIVRILDTFTSLTAELTAELTARRKQYEYYRDSLLTRETKVEVKKLGEVCEISRGVRVTRDMLSESGNIPVYQNALIPLGFFDKSNRTGNKTFVIGAGAAGKIGFSDVDFWAADDCYTFDNLKGINDKYLFYFLQTKQSYIDSRVRKGSIPRISRDNFEKITIPIPSLEVQQRIVNVLDNFDSICTDLKIGLPAEIEARKKQYEYYRDLLLTFASSANTILTEQNRTEQNRTEQMR